MVSDQNASRFRERLENDFDVYLRGNQNPSNLFDASVIARMEDLKNNTKKPGEEKGTREKVAIGHGDCNVSLIALVQSLARIVTGRKVKPNIFTEIGAEKRELERIEGSEVFSCYKDILNRTSLGGTADVLREADYGGLKIFPREKRMYAKTGTYGEQDKGIQQTYIVFGTENYFFGVILNEKPSPAKHAKNLAKDFLPYVRAYCPEYLE
jgi:cell division protein FtsI/penicillin-binding protein 2